MPDIYRRHGEVEIELLGVKFRPREGINYLHDYVEAAEDMLKHGADSEYAHDGLRYLILEDLWFLTYFIVTKGKPEEFPIVNDEKGWFVERAKNVSDFYETYVMDLWGRFHGKMLSHDQLIPTPSGMRRHGDLRPDDLVFNRDGNIVKVIAESETFNGLESYLIRFDDGTEILAGAEHLWFIDYTSKKRVGDWKQDRREGRVEEILRTVDIYEHYQLRKRYLNRTPFSIRNCEPLMLDEKELPVKPYTLGQWLGDGTSGGGAITSGDSATWVYIENEGYELSRDRTPLRNSQLRTVYGMQPVLRKNKLLNNKHIPELYFVSSYRQRLALLQGLMDSDGHLHSDNVAIFTNINKRLSMDVKRLAESLGYKCFFKERIYANQFDDAYIYYDVRFTCYTDLEPPFKLKRKAEKIRETQYNRRKRYIVSVEKADSVPSKCIQVEGDGSYLVGSECIPTHNSLLKTTSKTVQYHLKHPDHCTLILSYKKGAAEKFQDSIMKVWEDEYMKMLFPMRLYDNPHTQAPSWGLENGATIKRDNKARKEKTVESSGLIEGMKTGGHYERLIFDDVSTIDLAKNVDSMNDCFEKFQVALNLGFGTERDIFDVSGTYYHHQDPLVKIGKMMHPNGGPLFNMRKYPSTDNGKRDGKPVLVTDDHLELLKMRSDFATQHLLDPTPQGEQELDGNRLQVINHDMIPEDATTCFMLVDPAGDETKDGCDWAIGKVLVEPNFDNLLLSKWYIVELFMENFSHDKAISTILSVFLRGDYVHQVGIEDDRSMTHKFVVRELESKGRVISEMMGTLKLLKHQGRNKDNRIASAWQWPLMNDCCFISSRIDAKIIDKIKTQLDNFPFGLKDGIDMLAYLPDIINDYNMWQTGYDEDDDVDNSYDYVYSGQDGRSEVTGY